MDIWEQTRLETSQAARWTNNNLRQPARLATHAPPRATYSRLASSELRLFRIRHLDNETGLVVELEIFSFAMAPEYVAISYCWGDMSLAVGCRCNDDILIDISSSLFEALRHCWSPGSDGYWWADQICIDQSSDLDKAQQVPQMRRIYGDAARVIIWVGLDNDETQEVFDLLFGIRDQIPWSCKVGNDYNWAEMQTICDRIAPDLRLPALAADGEDGVWSAFTRLLTRPWFSRTWTLQELVLAKSAYLACGPYSIEWGQMALIIYTVAGYDEYQRPPTQHISRVRFLELAEWTLKRGPEEPQFDLCDILKRTMRCTSSVPQDKIYGILGLIDRPDLSDLPIDYTLPFRTLFAHITKRVIAYRQDLSVLSLKRSDCRSGVVGMPELPSWVPDFRYDSKYTSWEGARGSPYVLHGDKSDYWATGASRTNIAVDYDLSLSVQGLKISRLQVASKPSGTLKGGVVIGPNVRFHGSWAKTAELCQRDGIYHSTGEDWTVAFCRAKMWMSNRSRQQEEKDQSNRFMAPPAEPRWDPGHSTYTEGPDSHIEIFGEEFDDITPKLVAGTIDRRLFVDDANRMVFAHETCKVSDEVWLLLGCDKPCILRPLSTGTYQFKGHAFVPGIMDGEYLFKRFKRRSDPKAREMNDDEWLTGLKESVPFATTTITLI